MFSVVSSTPVSSSCLCLSKKDAADAGSMEVELRTMKTFEISECQIYNFHTANPLPVCLPDLSCVPEA